MIRIVDFYDVTMLPVDGYPSDDTDTVRVAVPVHVTTGYALIRAMALAMEAGNAIHSGAYEVVRVEKVIGPVGRADLAPEPDGITLPDDPPLQLVPAWGSAAGEVRVRMLQLMELIHRHDCGLYENERWGLLSTENYRLLIENGWAKKNGVDYELTDAGRAILGYGEEET